MKMDRRLWTILLIQITEVLGFSLILPFLPFYAQSLGASPLAIASIISVFSLFQFISAPIMGRLSDHVGRRPMLLLSQLSTFIGFMILGSSKTLGMIFLSRIVDGALGSNFTIAQAYISDISKEKDRSKAFGVSGAAFGIGFLVGPAIGGYLSKFGFSIPAYLAAGISLLTIFLTLMFLPETVRTKKKKMGKVKIIDLEVLVKYFTNPLSARSLWVFLTFIMTTMVWQGNFAIYSGKKWNFTADKVGWVLAYIGLVNVVLRGFLIGKMIDKWGESRLKRVGIISVMLAMIGFGVIRNGKLVAVVLSLLAFGSGILRPILMGDISRSVRASEQGAILGVASSLGSLAQVVGPLIGGYLLTNFFPESLMVVSVLIMGTGFGLILFRRKNSIFIKN